MPKKEEKDILTIVEKTATELFKLIGSKSVISVSEDKENDAVVVDLESQEEAGLLIGSRGDNILSFQNILGMIVRNKTGEWKRILVNVGDWREKQNKRLNELAIQTAERALSTKKPQPLYNLTPAQRRIVHMALSSDKKVETESAGEGRDRYLLVTPVAKDK